MEKRMEAMIKRYGQKNAKAGQILNLGNDFKGAQTDALKKAASHFGICLDVYSKKAWEDFDGPGPEDNGGSESKETMNTESKNGSVETKSKIKSDAITPEQEKVLLDFATDKELNLMNDIDTTLKTRYKVNTIKYLTKEQAEEFINKLYELFPQKKNTETQSPEVGKIGKEQIKKLNDIFSKKGFAPEDIQVSLETNYKVSKVEDLTVDAYKSIIKKLGYENVA